MASKVFLVQCNGYRIHRASENSIQALRMTLEYSNRFVAFQHEHPTAEIRETVHLATPGEQCEAEVCSYCRPGGA